MKVVSGRLTIGPENGFRANPVVKPAVSRTGEVSPIPRAVPRMTAVMSPDREVGITTCRTMRHRGAPRAAAASLSVPGTRRRTTSAARITIGSIMTAMAMAAAKPDFWPTPSTSCRVTINASTNSPAMIDGSAVIASTTVRTRRDSRVRLSDR